jgi:hypothetical protein
VRYYLGVDWADQSHAVWVVDENGKKIAARTVPHTVEGLSQCGRELDEWRAQGIELWAAIERPEGRVVDFLLDHSVVVYPVNPKALDRARDRFRQSGAKSDPFDARVLADFLRTDHAHLQALQPSSETAQELKLLTDDYQRHIRQQTRLINQLTVTLKAYYPRALEVAELATSRCAFGIGGRAPAGAATGLPGAGAVRGPSRRTGGSGEPGVDRGPRRSPGRSARGARGRRGGAVRVPGALREGARRASDEDPPPDLSSTC